MKRGTWNVERGQAERGTMCYLCSRSKVSPMFPIVQGRSKSVEQCAQDGFEAIGHEEVAVVVGMNGIGHQTGMAEDTP